MNTVQKPSTETNTNGSLPTLFVSVGLGAEETLRELSRQARCLTVPVAGPFGLVLVDVSGDDVFAADWTWVGDLDVPDLALVREQSESVGRDEQRLGAALSSLVRKLRCRGSIETNRVRLNSYLVVDLSTEGAVVSGFRLMRALREADRGQEMTVLALTGRVAEANESDGDWFNSWTLLIKNLQDDPLAQRVYLLDGRDTNNTWFERPQQLYHHAAAFLLFHGLTCRDHLRQHERAVIKSKENVLNVCGSFGHTEIRADLSEVARRVAQRIAREDLSDFYKGTLSKDWLDDVGRQADRLIETVGQICDRAKPTIAGQNAPNPGQDVATSGKLSEAIEAGVLEVCAREPMLSLCHFLRRLLPGLRRLVTARHFAERSRIRRHVGEMLRRQDVESYGPMRAWLACAGVQWADPFTPRRESPSYISLSKPASVANYVAGLILLALAAIAVGGASLLNQTALAGVGGVVVVAAAVLMTLPLGWSQQMRVLGQSDQQSAGSSSVLYRRRAPLWIRWTSVAMVVTGLVAVAWSLYSGQWRLVEKLGVAVSAVLGVTGFGLLLACPAQVHPDQASRSEAPDHARPPRWGVAGAGYLCLAMAWLTFCLSAGAPARIETPVGAGVHLAGLLLVVLGIGWRMLPRMGHPNLSDRGPKLPKPVIGGIGRPTSESTLDRKIVDIVLRIERLTLEPGRCLLRAKVDGKAPGPEVLFDFLSDGWESSLAEAFRAANKSQGRPSLSALALRPEAWARCIAKLFRDDDSGCSDPASIFALDAVKAWMDSHSLGELTACLPLDAAVFRRRVARLAPIHWPMTRLDPDVTATLIAVPQSLWSILAPLARHQGPWSMVRVDWNAEADSVIVVRIAQGLSCGWRGFPGLPGQILSHGVGNPAGPDHSDTTVGGASVGGD